VLLPTFRDPRLHLAAIIISLHVLGQTVFDFRLSIAQILVSLLTSAVLEVAITFRQQRVIMWPASALLTGNGVAFILRVPGTEHGDWWSTRGLWIFAATAAISLLSKYVIRVRGGHIFNPSNFGLVLCFLVLGSARAEPLDFWWGPMSVWLALAIALIVAGGFLILRRLRLLWLAVSFWIVFAAGIGLLAAAGHVMTARWHLGPIVGEELWRALVFSPEILVFLFFMITDPKTIPARRVPRVLFAVGLALVSTLLIAPQSTEFGAKVGLLASLVLLSPIRGLFDRYSAASLTGIAPTPWRTYSRGVVLGVGVAVVAIGIVAAGGPARVLAGAGPSAPPTEISVEVDPTTLPIVSVADEVAALNSNVAESPQQLAVALAENLAIEAEAMRRADASVLRGADDGERLIQQERRIEMAATAEQLSVPRYLFETLHLHVVHTAGPQGGASLALDARGTVETITYDSQGAELGRETIDFAATFVLRQAATGRWLITAELPLS
jgi:Na+-translocating ferredoxin:NAD+ oxidoreductase RnfD subunit